MEMFNLIYDHILIDSRKRNRDINGDDDDDDNAQYNNNNGNSSSSLKMSENCRHGAVFYMVMKNNKISIIFITIDLILV